MDPKQILDEWALRHGRPLPVAADEAAVLLDLIEAAMRAERSYHPVRDDDDYWDDFLDDDDDDEDIWDDDWDDFGEDFGDFDDLSTDPAKGIA